MLVRLQPVQKKEARVTANVLLSLIDRMRGDAALSKRYLSCKAEAYNVHGRLAFDEGTEESARRAVIHFEKSLQVFEATGYAEGVVIAKSNIAEVQSKYEGGMNNEEFLKMSQQLYEMRVSEFGEGNEYTIRAGKIHAIELQKTGRGGNASELLMKLLATSKQVLGPDHITTKEVVLALKSFNSNALN
jgi:hypothetical protein